MRSRRSCAAHRTRGAASARRILVVLASLALGSVALACLPETGPPPGPQPRRVAIYGDSLLHSSAPVWRTTLEEQLPDWALLERASWGSAPCDHLEQMVADARSSWNVRVVVLGFFGNTLTACSKDRPAEAMYRSDLTRAVDLWLNRGVRVVLVVPPGRVGDEPYSEAGRAALAVARDRRVTLVDTTGSFVDPASGTFAGQVDGTVLRSPDGIHLCDHRAFGEAVCPTDAPGAVRYATPIANAVVAEARLVK